MTVSTSTSLVYPLSDFTTSGGVVNSLLLKAELESASLSVSVLAVSLYSDECVIKLDGNATEDDVTAVDAVVAAHAGSAFGSTLQKVVDEADESDDTGTEVVKATLTTGPMPAGTYLVGWYMEVKTTTNTGTSGSRGLMYVTKNGGARNERGQTNNGENQWRQFSGSLAVDLVDGDQYTFELVFTRIGVAGNAAHAQRARLTWTKLNGA